MKDYQAFLPFSPFSSPIPFTPLSLTVSKPHPLNVQANALCLIVAEAEARREVSKQANVPSGALPVLALLVFRYEQRKISHPAAVYAANIANVALVRSYIRLLVDAELIALTVRRGCRTLRPTLTGLGLASKYYRAVREGRYQIETY